MPDMSADDVVAAQHFQKVVACAGVDESPRPVSESSFEITCVSKFFL